MSTLAIHSSAHVATSVAKATSSLLARLNRVVQSLHRPHVATVTAPVDRVAGVRQMLGLAEEFEQFDPALAAELRFFAGRG